MGSWASTEVLKVGASISSISLTLPANIKITRQALDVVGGPTHRPGIGRCSISPYQSSARIIIIIITLCFITIAEKRYKVRQSEATTICHAGQH